ncbi:MAG: DUF6036 family nucleotidyltransferase [Acidimicrobiales bacterium]
MSEPLLDREGILAALRALDKELERTDTRAQLFVVGGAAIALAFNTRRITRDVDAVFEPKSVVLAAARRVAAQLGLPDDWLNDAVKGYLPGADPDAQPVLSLPNLEVAAGSGRYLLALKLLATRIGEDDDDIKMLLDYESITSVDEALDLVVSFYPAQQIQPKTQFFLEELLGPTFQRLEGEEVPAPPTMRRTLRP